MKKNQSNQTFTIKKEQEEMKQKKNTEKSKTRKLESEEESRIAGVAVASITITRRNGRCCGSGRVWSGCCQRSGCRIAGDDGVDDQRRFGKFER